MELNKQINEIQDNNWISLTGYRTLFVLKLLLEKGRSTDELISILEKNKYTSKSLSKDTLRVTLNTLKKAGCKLSRPVQSNNYKYEILSHPFGLNLSQDDMNILFKIRQKIAENISWNEIIRLNEFYEKIFALTFNENLMLNEQYTRPLINIDKYVLNTLTNPHLAGKKLKLIYASPQNGEEELDVIYKKLKYDNENLYLWCYIFKYNVNNYLNLKQYFDTYHFY